MKTKKFRLGFVCFCLCVSFCLAAALPALASSGTITGPSGHYGLTTYRTMPGDTHDVVETVTNRDNNAIFFYIKFLDQNGIELCRYPTDGSTVNVPAHGNAPLLLTLFLVSQNIASNTQISPVIVWSGARINITPICGIYEYTNDSSGNLLSKVGFVVYDDNAIK